jgi:3-phosphoglycerate kinase
MKNALAILLVTAAALAAQASASTGATASKSARKPVAAKAAKKVTSSPQHPVVIPKDAVANSDGSYTWKDKQGKSWLFVKTPFGVMKSQAGDASASSTSTAMAGVKAFDEGDKVRFERPSPFGPMKWEKNKSELTEEERAVVSSQAASQNAK